MKRIIVGFIPLILFLLSILILAFTDNQKYVVIRGEKYYKCSHKIQRDTTENPGGITITEIHIKTYDHFKCK